MLGFKRKRLFAKNLFLGYVSGDIDIREFWDNYKSSLLMQNALMKLKPYKGVHSLPFTIEKLFLIPKNLLDKFDMSLFSHRVQLYHMAECYLLTHKINFISRNRDKLKYDLIAETLPFYVLVLIDNMDYLYHILETAPKGLSENEFKIWAKNKFIALFRYDDIPPDWLQDPEWPFMQGEPLCFRSQEETNNGIVKYYFYSPKTNEEVVVEQVE